MSNNKGLSGILKDVNDTTRTVNSVKNTTKNVKKTACVGNKKNTSQAQKNQVKEVSWVCDCGITSTTKFCSGCGKPAPTELVCPKCKWKRPLDKSDLKFCGNCGTQLEE